MRRAAVASATRPAVEVPGVRDEVLRPAAVAKVWTGVGAPLETMAVPGVVLAPGEWLTPAQVQAHVAGRLAAYKVPLHVHVRHDSLPRNPAGKMLKSTLKREYPPA